MHLAKNKYSESNGWLDLLLINLCFEIIYGGFDWARYPIRIVVGALGNGA